MNSLYVRTHHRAPAPATAATLPLPVLSRARACAPRHPRLTTVAALLFVLACAYHVRRYGPADRHVLSTERVLRQAPAPGPGLREGRVHPPADNARAPATRSVVDDEEEGDDDDEEGDPQWPPKAVSEVEPTSKQGEPHADEGYLDADPAEKQEEEDSSLAGGQPALDTTGKQEDGRTAKPLNITDKEHHDLPGRPSDVIVDPTTVQHDAHVVDADSAEGATTRDVEASRKADSPASALPSDVSAVSSKKQKHAVENNDIVNGLSSFDASNKTVIEAIEKHVEKADIKLAPAAAGDDEIDTAEEEEEGLESETTTREKESLSTVDKEGTESDTSGQVLDMPDKQHEALSAAEPSEPSEKLGKLAGGQPDRKGEGRTLRDKDVQNAITPGKENARDEAGDGGHKGRDMGLSRENGKPVQILTDAGGDYNLPH